MAIFSHFPQIYRFFGPKWLSRRLWYAFRVRAGILERQIPASQWSEQPLRNFLSERELAESQAYLAYRRQAAPPFFFKPDQILEYRPTLRKWDGDGGEPVTVAEEVAAGLVTYFHGTRIAVGFPPAWHKNPFTGTEFPDQRHWSAIDDFGHGDIKIIWELNRFGFVYALVRAYARTGDEKYGECFWQLVDDWYRWNPPQFGANWKCGQEISFRVMAWLFGLYGFLQTGSATAERVSRLAQMIAVSGRRIEANLSYALNQRNNHGISEGMGLWTVGVLFPEFDASSRWQQTGRRVLEAQARELIYEDGSFAQHSLNYHRLMLHDYLWALRLGELTGTFFSDELYDRIRKAGQLLYQLQAGVNGEVPNYGHNDGSLILPLSNTAYGDFRPVIQAVHYLATQKRCYEPGGWDEDLLWLFGSEAIDASVEPPQTGPLQADVGGYYTLHGNESFAFVRCSDYQDRPGQADALHLDLWWRGHNIAIDAGTYSYNALPPWNNPLSHTSVHNTVTVDSKDQMDRVGKFIWLPWLSCSQPYNRRTACFHYWEGRHDGYERLEPGFAHQRAILLIADEVWLVLDRLSGVRPHHFRVHWLLPDFPYVWRDVPAQVDLETPAGKYYIKLGAFQDKKNFSLVRATRDGARGWRTRHYLQKEPAVSLALEVDNPSLFAWTIFTPFTVDVTEEGAGQLELQAPEWHTRIILGQDNRSSPVISAAEISGSHLSSKMEMY